MHRAKRARAGGAAHRPYAACPRRHGGVAEGAQSGQKARSSCHLGLRNCHEGLHGHKKPAAGPASRLHPAGGGARAAQVRRAASGHKRHACAPLRSELQAFFRSSSVPRLCTVTQRSGCQMSGASGRGSGLRLTYRCRRPRRLMGVDGEAQDRLLQRLERVQQLELAAALPALCRASSDLSKTCEASAVQRDPLRRRCTAASRPRSARAAAGPAGRPPESGAAMGVFCDGLGLGRVDVFYRKRAEKVWTGSGGPFVWTIHPSSFFVGFVCSCNRHTWSLTLRHR